MYKIESIYGTIPANISPKYKNHCNRPQILAAVHHIIHAVVADSFLLLFAMREVRGRAVTEQSRVQSVHLPDFPPPAETSISVKIN